MAAKKKTSAKKKLVAAKKKVTAKKKTTAKKKLAAAKKKTTAKKKLVAAKKKTTAKKKLVATKKTTTAKKKLVPARKSQALRPALGRAASEKAALCSSRVVGPKRKDVLFAYRQEPDNEQDSGWRFLRGDESETFLGDPKNCLVCPLSLVFEMDPSLEDLTRSKGGAAFRRASVDARWEPIADYDPEA